MKRASGFTIMEVLIVLGIMSVLLVIALPSFGKIHEYREVREVRGIVETIKTVRNRAQRERQYLTLRFDDKNVQLESARGDILQSDTLEAVSFHSSNQGQALSFTVDGRPGFETSGRYIFSGKTKKYSVIVAPVSGEVRMETE